VRKYSPSGAVLAEKDFKPGITLRSAAELLGPLVILEDNLKNRLYITDHELETDYLHGYRPFWDIRGILPGAIRTVDFGQQRPTITPQGNILYSDHLGRLYCISIGLDKLLSEGSLLGPVPSAPQLT